MSEKRLTIICIITAIFMFVAYKLAMIHPPAGPIETNIMSIIAQIILVFFKQFFAPVKSDFFTRVRFVSNISAVFFILICFISAKIDMSKDDRQFFRGRSLTGVYLMAVKKFIYNFVFSPRQKPQLKIHPLFPLKPKEEFRTLIVGRPGSGKTQILLYIMSQIIDNIYNKNEDNTKLIVLDTKKDYYSKMDADDDDIILFAPWDKRGCSWDIYNDIQTANEADFFAKFFIPQDPSEKDKFWTDSARQVLTAIIVDLIDRQIPWGFGDLYQNTIMCDLESLTKTLQKRGLDSYIGDGTSNMTVSILATLKSKLSFLSYLAAAEQQQPKFSFKNFIKNEGNKILVLQKMEKYPFSENLISCVISYLATTALDIPDSTVKKNQLKSYFLLDELAEIPKIDKLISMLSNGRSKGIRTFIGIQDLALFEARYGNNLTNSTGSMIDNWIILKVAESGSSCENLSQSLGEAEVMRKTDDDGIVFEKKRVVLPSEIASLPLPRLPICPIFKYFDGGIVGYLNLSGLVTKARWPLRYYDDYRAPEILANWTKSAEPYKIIKPKKNKTCKNAAETNNNSKINDKINDSKDNNKILDKILDGLKED